MKAIYPLLLALGGLSVVSLAQEGRVAFLHLQTTAEPLEKPVNGTWSDGHGESLTVLGVCSVDPKVIGCWDLQGALSPDLAEKLKARKVSAQGDRDFDFRFGKKNRYLVFQLESSQLSNQFSSQPSAQFRAMGGVTFNGMFQYITGQTKGQGQSTFGIVHVIAEPNEALLDAVATINGLPGPRPVTVPFKEGSKAQHDGQTITLGGWAKGGLPQPGDPYYGFRFVPGWEENNSAGWTLYFGFNPGGINLNLSALDKEGRVIQYVDSHGHPVSEAQFKENGPRFPESFPSVPVTGRFAEAKISPGYDSLNLERAKAYSTNIDPRVIASLRISTTHFKSVLFKDIPLDPLKFRSISGGGAR